MQRFMESYRQKVDILKGEISSRTIHHEGDDNDDNHTMASTNSATTSQIIFDKLGCCVSQNGNDNTDHATDIPHVRQTETWDCGLACIQMILAWSRGINMKDIQNIDGSEGNSSSNGTVDKTCSEKAWMVEFVATKSIWTIDLVILLEHIRSGAFNIHIHANQSIDQMQVENIEERCNSDGQECQNILQPGPCDPFPTQSLRYLFCSTHFGVDESYNNLGYYKDAFSSDELRVKNLFDVAEKQDLPLLETSHVSLDVLVDVVSRKGIVAIVLLDNRVLRKNDMNTNCYSGHYVTLCGVSYDDNDITYAQINSSGEKDTRPKYCMVVKNPGIWKQVEFITPSLFEEAWRAKGTDEDVIFLSKGAI